MLVLAAAVAFASSRTDASPTLPQVVTPRPLRTTAAVVPTLPPAASEGTAVAPVSSGVTTPVAVPVAPKAEPPHKPTPTTPVEKPVPPQPKAQPKPKSPAQDAPAREVVTPYVREEDEESRRPVDQPATTLSHDEHHRESEQDVEADGSSPRRVDAETANTAEELQVPGSHRDAEPHRSDARPGHEKQRAAGEGRS
jgi:hypothetical protein